MKKFTSMVLSGIVLSAFAVGCGEKTEQKQTTKVTTPGGTTTTEKTETVKKTGDNPPPKNP